MKIVAITQARLASSRLPRKVLLPLGDSNVLDIHLKRLKKSKLVTSFIVATTSEPDSSLIEDIATANGYHCFHGDENDVLGRFYHSCKDLSPDVVVRVTSDCPLLDPAFVDDLIEKFNLMGCDYVSNCIKPTLPDGADVEVFTFAALEQAFKLADKNSEREHVTPFIRNSDLFKVDSIEYPEIDKGHLRLTLDTVEDYKVIQALVNKIGTEGSLIDYINFLENNDELLNINSMYERNEGLRKSLREEK